MSVHDGHRERLRSSFLEHGLKGFSTVTALELLLFYAIPRQDTNPIAHALLDRFGSLDQVFSASEQELCEVPGVGRSTAALILLLPQLVQKSEMERNVSLKQITRTKDAVNYLEPFFLFERDELAVALLLDSEHRVLRCVELNRGVVNSVDVSVRKVVETALRQRASFVILAHNHPDGNPMPSAEDDMFTRGLYHALEAVGLTLEDHLILTNGNYSSYRDSGALSLVRYQPYPGMNGSPGSFGRY